MRADGICKRGLTAGIDVGGTNTDGVLYEPRERRVEGWVKIATDHSDYGGCVERALEALVSGGAAGDIISLNISTTLSTNALLEGAGAPVNLVLIGFEDFPHIKKEILNAVSPAALLEARGGHNGRGIARAPLDEEALRSFAARHAGEYFALSSLYSPRNPEHELRAAELIREAGCAGLTCGHELARSKLNSVRRSVTAFLNSSLMPLTRRLISGVEASAARIGLECPLMFLRSDSSLVCADWCLRFPIETIFSGPAASMRGAMIIGGIQGGDALVADMGGTSTDIGLIRNGGALYSREGAEIGGYRTMIPSLEISSIALGGDSRVDAGEDGSLSVGLERVLPLCRGGLSYTPSDALCALGLLAAEEREKSLAASDAFGRRLGLTAEGFAKLVRAKTSARLLDAISAAGGGGLKKICVGAPTAAFVPEGAEDWLIPEAAAIASAVGAASASLSLSCSVSIVHNFFDESFSAFLPSRMIKGKDFEAIRAEAAAALDEHLRRQSRMMGFDGAETETEEEYEYFGDGKGLSSLAALTLNGRAVVRNAQ
ncbi:MAG: hydantoinase/oxoprolinase family protein [Synergistaceae bacterium]|nr:hydantoinase/oxoprolinase family protein [Synergistaceae bacterium]